MFNILLQATHIYRALKHRSDRLEPSTNQSVSLRPLLCHITKEAAGSTSSAERVPRATIRVRVYAPFNASQASGNTGWRHRLPVDWHRDGQHTKCMCCSEDASSLVYLVCAWLTR